MSNHRVELSEERQMGESGIWDKCQHGCAHKWVMKMPLDAMGKSCWECSKCKEFYFHWGEGTPNK